MAIYINIPEYGTYSLDCSRHAAARCEGRDIVNPDFICGRLETLLMDNAVVDSVLNGIYYGEDFLLDDMDMGYTIAVSHVLEKDYGLLMVKTVCHQLRAGHMQKVITIKHSTVSQFAQWNNELKRMEVIEW